MLTVFVGRAYRHLYLTETIRQNGTKRRIILNFSARKWSRPETMISIA
jgi:hypothetical protein